MNSTSGPIGIFDSGIGGLTVFEKISEELPNESIIYFGDTARLPYGTKSKSVVKKFSLQIVKFLITRKIKMIVVACNTVSAYALDALKKNFKIPIIGVIEPGVKYAIMKTKNKRIGVIGTTATIKSQVYTKLIRKYDKSIKTYSQACPLFVPLVEEGWFNNNKKIVSSIARKYLLNLKKFYIDTLVLGCTHYPLLGYIIQNEIGKKVQLISSAESVAKETKHILERNKILSNLACTVKMNKPKYTFYVSDEPEKFVSLAGEFLNRKDKIAPTKKNTRKIDIEQY